MATAVYLLYATMHNTKESLEHFLLEGHHGGDHHEETSFGFGMILSLIIAVGTCCLSSIALRNHENFVQCKQYYLFILFYFILFYLWTTYYCYFHLLLLL